MAVFNLYSKQQRKLREGEPDTLTYDNLPKQLRVQIIHILNDAFEQGTSRMSVEQYYTIVRDILIKEYGVFELNSAHSLQDEVSYFIQYEDDVDKVLDAVSLSFKVIDKILRKNIHDDYAWERRKLNPDEAIEDLNTRFKEHAVGYSFNEGEIIRIDSTYTHAEIVKPALQLLSNQIFSGANQEYLKAHDHYRHGKNKECLTECLKAFESTLKIIFTNKGWTFSPTATASTLINVALTNNLVPTYLQSQLAALRSLLESGIPTLRNKLGGHGQGATLTTVDDETARYGLNLTGSNIIYLIELSKL